MVKTRLHPSTTPRWALDSSNPTPDNKSILDVQPLASPTPSITTKPQASNPIFSFAQQLHNQLSRGPRPPDFSSGQGTLDALAYGRPNAAIFASLAQLAEQAHHGFQLDSVSFWGLPGEEPYWVDDYAGTPTKLQARFFLSSASGTSAEQRTMDFETQFASGAKRDKTAAIPFARWAIAAGLSIVRHHDDPSAPTPEAERLVWHSALAKSSARFPIKSLDRYMQEHHEEACRRGKAEPTRSRYIPANPSPIESQYAVSELLTTFLTRQVDIAHQGADVVFDREQALQLFPTAKARELIERLSALRRVEPNASDSSGLASKHTQP